MAELGLDTRYNIVDALKLVKNNRYVPFATVLAETNDMFMDMPVSPANGILSHEGSRETSLPTPQIIKIGDGWDASVVQWDNFKEDISLFKDRADVPLDVYDLQPEPARWRAQVIDRHIAGMGQGITNHIIYGTSATAPEKFDGLDVRYKTPDASDEISVTNGDFGVYDAGATGSDTMSIWLVQWGYEKIYGITPINDPHMGIKEIDRGMQEVTAENSKTRTDLRTNLQMKIGICVHDVRSVARIRNISRSVTADHSALVDKIIQAREEVFRGNEQVWMYVSHRGRTIMKLLNKNKMNVEYDKNNPYEIPLFRFDDMPIRLEESLDTAETAVAAA